MSDTKVISLRELSKEVGMKCEKLFEYYSLPIVIKANTKTGQKALYDYDLIMGIFADYIRLYVKPSVEERLRETGVEFNECVMDESVIKGMLDDMKVTGNADLYSNTVMVIFKDSDRVAQEYGLYGKSYFAKKLQESSSIHKMSAMHRVSAVIKAFDLKPVAYSKKLAPVYDADALERAYAEWTTTKKLK